MTSATWGLKWKGPTKEFYLEFVSSSKITAVWTAKRHKALRFNSAKDAKKARTTCPIGWTPGRAALHVVRFVKRSKDPGKIDSFRRSLEERRASQQRTMEIHPDPLARAVASV